MAFSHPASRPHPTPRHFPHSRYTRHLFLVLAIAGVAVFWSDQAASALPVLPSTAQTTAQSTAQARSLSSSAGAQHLQPVRDNGAYRVRLAQKPAITVGVAPVSTVNGAVFQASRIVLPVASAKFHISSGFGARNAPTAGASTMHSGIDIPVPIGTSVVAIADGTVIAVGSQSAMGLYVDVLHVIDGVPMVSHYQHLSQSTTKVGAKVIAGQQIAKSGNSGIGTGAHLHFSLAHGTSFDLDQVFDPQPWLAQYVNA